MSAAQKLSTWEEPDTLRFDVQSAPAANDNAVQAPDDARENSRLGIFVFPHTTLPACEPANDGFAPAKSETPRKTTSEAGITGKEEDVEVGLQYFGKRFLNPLLGRWVSADPLAVHAPGEADLNVYAYVSGAVLKAIDPLGLQDQCSGGDCDALPETPDDEGAAVDDTGAYGGAGNSANAPDAGTGHEGSGSNSAPVMDKSPVTGAEQRLNEGVRNAVIGGVIAALCPGCAIGMLIAASSTGATADNRVEPGHPDYSSRQQSGELALTFGELAGGGAAKYAVAQQTAKKGLKDAVADGVEEVGQQTADDILKQMDEVAESLDIQLQLAGTGGEDTVELFRFVSPGEYDDIVSSGQFRFAPGQMEAKQFGFDLAETLKLSNHFNDAAAIMRARVPRSTLQSLDMTPVDTFILRSGSVTARGAEQLNVLNGALQGSIEQVF